MTILAQQRPKQRLVLTADVIDVGGKVVGVASTVDIVLRLEVVDYVVGAALASGPFALGARRHVVVQVDRPVV